MSDNKNNEQMYSQLIYFTLTDFFVLCKTKTTANGHFNFLLNFFVTHMTTQPTTKKARSEQVSIVTNVSQEWVSQSSHSMCSKNSPGPSTPISTANQYCVISHSGRMLRTLSSVYSHQKITSHSVLFLQFKCFAIMYCPRIIYIIL